MATQQFLTSPYAMLEFSGQWGQILDGYTIPGTYLVYDSFTNNEFGQEYAGTYAYLLQPYVPPPPPAPEPAPAPYTPPPPAPTPAPAPPPAPPAPPPPPAPAPYTPPPAYTPPPPSPTAPTSTPVYNPYTGAFDYVDPKRRTAPTGAFYVDQGAALYGNEDGTTYANPYYGVSPEGYGVTLGNAYKGAGWYNPVHGTYWDEWGGGNTTSYEYLGAMDPVSVYNRPQDTGLWYYDAAEGSWKETPGQTWNMNGEYGGQSYGIPGLSLADSYGPISRDQFMQSFYNPFANVEGVISPDYFLSAGYTPESYQRHMVLAGSDNQVEAGRSSVPLGRTFDVLNAYMNQPALVAARGGKQFNWQEIPELKSVYDQQWHQAKAQAQQSHDVNTGGIPWQQLVAGALSVWAPGLTAAFAPAMTAAAAGGLGAGVEAAGGILAGTTAAGAAMPWQSLAINALGQIDPQLGQIASAVNMGTGLFNSFAAPSTPASLDSAIAAMGDSGMTAEEINRFNYLSNLDMQDADIGNSWGVNAPVHSVNIGDFATPGALEATPDFDPSVMYPGGTEGPGLFGATIGDFAGQGDPFGNFDMGYGETGTQAPEGLPNEAAPEQAPTEQPEEQRKLPITPKQILQAAQLVFKLAAAAAGEEGPEGKQGERKLREAPQRREDQTPEEHQQEVVEYVQEVADYLGIPETNLDPGSPEFFNYITKATNDIIKNILGQDAEFLDGATPEELSSLLEGKRKSELIQLARALYVRGQMATLSFNDQALNPFSDEVIDLNYEGSTNPHIAAAQRGFKQESEKLAGKRGDEARAYYDSLTNRKKDLFGMQSRADANLLRAMLEARDEKGEKRRRKGEKYSTERTTLHSLIEGLDQRELQQVLNLIGDERRQAAALQQLFFAAEENR